MKYRERLWQKLITLIITSLVIFKASAGQLISNDLEQKEPGQYQITGGDPYIIFNARSPSSKVTHLLVDLGEKISDVPLELFFSSENDVFDPYYNISFTVTSFPAALKLPANIEITSSTRLRLDIDHCQNCLVKFENTPALINEINELDQVKPTSVLNGIAKLGNSTKIIPKNGWQLNGLEGVLDDFEISGIDPYLVTPRLTVSTHELAGVYVHLKAPVSGELWNNFQVFYQTERHAFSEQASSTVRIGESNNGVVKFMIPLHFLSTELPSDSVLERLRIDLPDISGKWALLEASLIHANQLNETKSLIPTQLIQIKHQRATGLALIKKSLTNITSDLAFLLSYLLLFVLTGLFFFRMYRSNN